jgi:hypothetical protein
MGFLDKLLGRSKDAAGSAADTAKDMGDKAADAASDAGDAMQDAFDSDKGESQLTESEQRLDNVRDQVLRDEDRMP